MNCVMRRKNTGWRADGNWSISYSMGIRDIRNVLTSVGIVVDKASDKSLKMMGVTMTLESGTTSRMSGSGALENA